MPLYEYQCEQCHHRFEKIQKFSDPAPEACPSCGAGPVVKLPSSPAIQFKGTGWYITDYAKKSGTDAGKTGSSEKSEGGKDGARDGGSKDGGGKDSGSKDSGSKDTGSRSEASGTSASGSSASAASSPPAKKTD